MENKIIVEYKYGISSEVLMKIPITFIVIALSLHSSQAMKQPISQGKRIASLQKQCLITIFRKLDQHQAYAILSDANFYTIKNSLRALNIPNLDYLLSMKKLSTTCLQKKTLKFEKKLKKETERTSIQGKIKLFDTISIETIISKSKDQPPVISCEAF